MFYMMFSFSLVFIIDFLHLKLTLTFDFLDSLRASLMKIINSCINLVV